MEKNQNLKIQDEEIVYYGVGSFIWEIVKVFFWALVVIIPIRVFLFQPFFVQGASMESNFEDGNYLVVGELGYKETKLKIGNTELLTINSFKELKRGDVVVFHYPKNPQQFFIKRVIALPGEKIEIIEGTVKIFNQENPEGFVLNENEYLSEGTFTKGTVSMQLSSGEYFVMGDNRAASFDSRNWGSVPKNDIVGKVFFRAWPFSDISVY